ncbi:MAG TPA: ribosome biogenesis GTPase YlqF [Clostridiales bacterium]|nr:ribosome biogenesis GTPase YlqF [Clostridiales bacterium]
MNKTIGWYPGHMAKAKRLLSQQLSRVDVVIEVCDARLPLSSRNPDLLPMIAHKNRFLVLNKADLANPAVTACWNAWFTQQGEVVTEAVGTRPLRALRRLIEEALRERMQRNEQRGVKRTVRAMVVGVPNVGKSTIINTLAGSKTLKAEDRPGVTRANQWVRIAPFIEIMDSPGLLWPRLDNQQAARRLAYIAAIRDEVLDTYRLAQSLAEELMVLEPELFMNRFRVEDASLRGQALMEAICVGRGFIGRGAVPDLDRGASVLLDEFRAGRIGRISLETPPAEDSHAH